MAKGTTIFLFILGLLAALLVGINVGKNLGKQELSNRAIEQSSNQPSPTMTLIPTIASPSATRAPKTTGISSYSDKTCGFSFSYPGSFLRSQTENAQSVIFTDPDDPNAAIATTCASSIPRPPVSSDKIEAVTIGGVAANLYHDQNKDGTPRDEVIVRNPNNGMEIIIAGFGRTFQQALSTFKFVE